MSFLDFPHPGVVPSLCRTREQYNVLAKLPVHIYAVDANDTNEIHWHDYTQIWYTISGSYYHTVNGVRSLQTAGCVSVIYPYSVHAVDTLHTELSDARIICISISDSAFVKNILPFVPLTYSLAAFDNFTLHPFTKLSGRDKELADDLCESALSEYQKNQAMIYHKIFNNIGKLLELCVKNTNTPLSKNELHIAHERMLHIRNAVHFITDNCSERIPLQSVSKSAMMSERSFTDKFKLTVGQTYHSYLIGVRMAKAADLLRYSTKSISEIAEECGFSNSGHFSNTCVDTFGINPAKLRRQFKEYARTNGEAAFQKSLAALWLYNWSEDELCEMRRFATGDW